MILDDGRQEESRVKNGSVPFSKAQRPVRQSQRVGRIVSIHQSEWLKGGAEYGEPDRPVPARWPIALEARGLGITP